MFFLMRMAFWLGLVLVLLPTEKTPEVGEAAADRRDARPSRLQALRCPT